MRNVTRLTSQLLGALIISLVLLTGACGQKGDLYKPEQDQQSSLSPS